MNKVIFLGLLHLVPLVICGEKYLRLYAPQRSTDPCYTDEGKPQKCIPDFVNAAYGAPVTASSTCGQKGAEKFCDLDNPSQCYTCENTSPRRKYSSTALTDLNNPNNVTCWRSEILQPSKPTNINRSNFNSNSISSPSTSSLTTSTLNGISANTKLHLDNITLTLSLGKAYELTYVSLQFCPKAIKPDSLAILKSMDFGRTWQPFQYYSSQCRQIYGRPNRETIQKSNEQEARCTDSHKFDGGSNMARGSRIAFSTLEGRPSARDFDSSKNLQEWVTATDIRVIFHRLQLPEDVGYDSENDDDEEDGGIDGDVDGDSEEDQQDDDNKKNRNDNSIGNNNAIDSTASTASMATFNNLGLHYAVSDFAVGGRCKCNGHASRCIPDQNGALTCDCRHNTAGRDCERCKPFYLDRPWDRATSKDSNECKSE